MMTDFIITPAHGLQMTAKRIADVLVEWAKHLSALRLPSRSACPPAWELTGITRVDRFDIAPWLSF
jgi:hypothetical protein